MEVTRRSGIPWNSDPAACWWWMTCVIFLCLVYELHSPSVTRQKINPLESKQKPVEKLNNTAALRALSCNTNTSLVTGSSSTRFAELCDGANSHHFRHRRDWACHLMVASSLETETECMLEPIQCTMALRNAHKLQVDLLNRRSPGNADGTSQQRHTHDEDLLSIFCILVRSIRSFRPKRCSSPI